MEKINGIVVTKASRKSCQINRDKSNPKIDTVEN